MYKRGYGPLHQQIQNRDHGVNRRGKLELSGALNLKTTENFIYLGSSISNNGSWCGCGAGENAEHTLDSTSHQHLNPKRTKDPVPDSLTYANAGF